MTAWDSGYFDKWSRQASAGRAAFEYAKYVKSAKMRSRKSQDSRSSSSGGSARHEALTQAPVLAGTQAAQASD